MDDSNVPIVAEPTSVAKNTNVKSPEDLKEFFSFLQADLDSTDLMLTEDQAIKLKRRLSSLRTGTHAAVPLHCPGTSRCPIKRSCPFTVFKQDGQIDYEASNPPVLQPCPLEKHFITQRIADYAQEYKLDVGSASTVALITKLAELDVYDMRMDYLLGAGDHEGQGMDLMRDEVNSIWQRDGVTYNALKIHPAWEIKTTIHRQRMEILDALLATPKAQARASAGQHATSATTSFVTNMSNLKSTIDKIRQHQARLESIEADFEEA